jgi:hypothetical protein
MYLCSPDVGTVGEALQRPQFGMRRITWPDEEGVEYNLAHGDWLRLLRRNSFEVQTSSSCRRRRAPARTGPATSSPRTGRARGRPIWVAHRLG